MFPYKGQSFLCLVYFCVCICRASATPIFNNWKEDYHITRGEIFRPSGEASQRTTFLNLVHFRQLIEEHPGLEKGDFFDQLISIAEFKVENCNKEHFSAIEYLIWWYSSNNKTNIEIYLEFIKKKMSEVCDDAFDKGILSEKVLFQHDTRRKY